MSVYIDQTGREVFIPDQPRRIISLVPSQTELLSDLGLEKEVIGITKFCIHPHEWFQTKTRVGGTKQLKPDIIRQLKPDLIIANKEENVKEQIEELAKEHPVWVTYVYDMESALQMMMDVSGLTGKFAPTRQIIHQIKLGFINLENILEKKKDPKLKTAYLVWRDPYMTIGGDTFINDMLERCGLENIFRNKTRYPEITIEEIKAAECELVLLSSEPFPFKQKHLEELQFLLPGTRIILVDGEMFSWYGTRMLQAPGYFTKLHQEINHCR